MIAEVCSADLLSAAEKLEQVESHVSHSGSMGGFMLPADRKKEEGQLHKISRDAAKAAIEQAKGMSSQVCVVWLGGQFQGSSLRGVGRVVRCGADTSASPLCPAASSQLIKDLLFNYRPLLAAADVQMTDAS